MAAEVDRDSIAEEIASLSAKSSGLSMDSLNCGVRGEVSNTSIVDELTLLKLQLTLLKEDQMDNRHRCNDLQHELHQLQGDVRDLEKEKAKTYAKLADLQKQQEHFEKLRSRAVFLKGTATFVSGKRPNHFQKKSNDSIQSGSSSIFLGHRPRPTLRHDGKLTRIPKPILYFDWSTLPRKCGSHDRLHSASKIPRLLPDWRILIIRTDQKIEIEREVHKVQSEEYLSALSGEDEYY